MRSGLEEQIEETRARWGLGGGLEVGTIGCKEGGPKLELPHGRVLSFFLNLNSRTPT